MTSLTVDDAGCVAAITKRIVNVSTAGMSADEVGKIQNTCVLFSIVVHCSSALRQCHAVMISKKKAKTFNKIISKTHVHELKSSKIRRMVARI